MSAKENGKAQIVGSPKRWWWPWGARRWTVIVTYTLPWVTATMEQTFDDAADAVTFARTYAREVTAL